MNCPPSRHPAFLVVACLALAGAWSTGAFEADLAEREPAAVDRVALLRDAPDCLDTGGTRRALCIYQSTLSQGTESTIRTAERAGPAAVPVRTTAVAERSTLGRVQDRPVVGTRATTATASR